MDVDEVTSANLIEITGVIKWFDVAKGFGFIVPDNGWPDVLLHVTCLRRDGFQTAYEGARVVVEAVHRRGACRHSASSRWTSSTAIHPAQMPAAAHPCYGEPTSGLERPGEVVQPLPRLRLPTRRRGHPDIFVHMETLRRFGITELRPGQYRAGALRAGPQGPDGCGGAAGNRTAWAVPPTECPSSFPDPLP